MENILNIGKANKHLAIIERPLYLGTSFSLDKVLLNFTTSEWWARNLKLFNIVDDLKYTLQGVESDSLQLLLYAYQYSGTQQSVINVCYALFGMDSNVVIENPSSATWIISINNANKIFNMGLIGAYNETQKGLIGEPSEGAGQKGIIGTSVQAITNANIFYFLKDFLPTGHFLEQININTESITSLSAPNILKKGGK